MKKEEIYVIENFTPNKAGVQSAYGLAESEGINLNYAERSWCKPFKFNDVWSLECVHREGGSEGAGEEHWIVLKLTGPDHASLWEVPGWYASHDGAYLEPENMFEVIEATTVIKVYNAK